MTKTSTDASAFVRSVAEQIMSGVLTHRDDWILLSELYSEDIEGFANAMVEAVRTHGPDKEQSAADIRLSAIEVCRDKSQSRGLEASDPALVFLVVSQRAVIRRLVNDILESGYEVSAPSGMSPTAGIAPCNDLEQFMTQLTYEYAGQRIVATKGDAHYWFEINSEWGEEDEGQDFLAILTRRSPGSEPARLCAGAMRFADELADLMAKNESED